MKTNYLFILLSCFSLLLSSCATKQGEDGPDTRTRISTGSALAICQNSCGGSSAYASITANGCRDGCERAAKAYPLADKEYSDWATCEDAVASSSANSSLNKALNDCQNSTDNIYRQQGCKDGAKAFYRATNPGTICKSVDPTYLAPGTFVAPPSENLSR